MEEVFEQLLNACGSQESVAEALGYTERQYRNIRSKFRRGEEINPRITEFICCKLQKLKEEHEHALLVKPGEKL